MTAQPLLPGPILPPFCAIIDTHCETNKMKTTNKVRPTKTLLSKICLALPFNLLAMMLVASNITQAEGSGVHDHAEKKVEKQKSHQHSGHHDHGLHKNPVGKPAQAKEVNKTVQVSMLDSMKYEFDQKLHIHHNEVVRFIVTNNGKIIHEFSIGNAEEQRKHAEMMRKMPGMQHKDGNTLSLKPGESGEIIWKFQADATIVFACNIPGHFEAGMFRRVKIKAHQ